ncbi:hypothetical protein [Mesorhizobium opportunistum]|uniref:Uncharacterized protein n=1 Tax=Mesorhizobium opportunistum (strain LMG 24607 / HAMBI 3007 / WSM2075) TaxID=536019 RepID=F7YCA2_MESOW|nr:hypothetical protein [Mesorhizobium opportunistum]AEH86635.1 hypothetical protein Mesop_2157 [Mesorhizobium opportunistum WSM2075]
MFDWLTGRRKRDQAFIAEMVRATAAGSNLASLRSALSTVGVKLPTAPGPELVAEAAAGLAHSLLRSTGKGLEDDDVLFTAGLFTFVAANHFSFKIAESFEQSATLAIAALVGYSRPDFDRLHEPVVNAYNSMSGAESSPILGIGKTIARWAETPSAENHGSLTRLFSFCLEHVGPA